LPTHQSLSGASDEDLLQRMLSTYPQRFGPDFWALFEADVAPHLPPRPLIVDLGCGPGLFIRDLGERYPAGALHGYDVTPAMIEHARRLPSAGALRFEARDVVTEPLPEATGSVHLVSMSSVLHVIEEPLPVLAEIRRVVAAGGIFLLHDWIRQPLTTYLAWRRDVLGESEAESRRRGFRLFPVHNKYTPEDWQWLLGEAGFAIRRQAQLRATHRLYVASADGALAPSATKDGTRS